MTKHQGTVDAARREKDRDRKRVERAKIAKLGTPKPSRVDYAICEALAFVLAASKSRALVFPGIYYPINLLAVSRVAIDILVSRFNYTRENSTLAVRKKLEPRPAHREVVYVPSLHSLPHRPAYVVDPPPGLGRVTP